MNRFILGGLSLLFLSAAVPTVKAQTIPIVESSVQRTTIKAPMDVTPFDLVYLGYQGFLSDAGIPTGLRLIEEYKSGRVTARDLVQASVTLQRLPMSKLNDSDYINYVNEQLKDLSTENDH